VSLVGGLWVGFGRGAPLLLGGSQRLDVAAQARAERANLEAVARRLRYHWLAEVALETGAQAVATAHTANDQAETVLHRLLRGTGLTGLAGIASQRALVPGVELLRPMLRVSRAEVLAYLQARNQPFRQDTSNLDPRLTRNRIRHDLLPRLQRYNPAIVDVLARLAEQAAEVSRELAAASAARIAEAERPRAGPWLVFQRATLAAATRQQIRECFRLVWKREGWPEGRMAFDDWDRLASVVLGELPAVDFPGGIRAQSRGQVVQVGRFR
ncbi:MAG: tRNA lysidine(34) synthetase TilS, partial [Gemmataceae bacterium]|nr:tRNA lysidine(34) synthetase TilS [Gemmataceae bacterium]MDW8263782.1 tRNA lysidine(34) synthetase TilS [Gemmataceae bacterium]